MSFKPKDLEYVRFADKLNQYTHLIKNIKLPRGSGKTRFINYILFRINVSYDSFIRHLEYLKYTNKTVKRNSHLKALYNIEALLDALLDIINK